MKFENINNLLSLRSLLSFLLLIAFVPPISACQSKELSRSQAQKMIVATDEYKQVMMLDFINRYLKENGRGAVEAMAPDEPEDLAIKNRIAEYYAQEPRVRIADYLGLVKTDLKRLNNEPKKDSSLYRYGFWYFEEKWTITAKGESLWTDYGLPAQATVIPLAKREFVSITGMTKLGDSQTGVEFSWRWSPNELGKYLDPSTAEFKSLPEDLRKNLTDNKYKIERNFTYDWGGERRGQAMFRKFDDGWRIEWTRF